MSNQIPDIDTVKVPRVGMLATIRNRRALIASVEPFDAKPEGRLHLVQLEYTDTEGNLEDTIVWERELNATLLEPTALPQITDIPPMPAADFDALQRAARWTALSPFLSINRSEPSLQNSIASPFFGAVQVDDYQMVPLFMALRMPRISLLIADDVGLGKTIEVGFILTELLLRRRIRRVLILCGASLRHQWQEEMKTKFALSFDVVDRPETHALQKRLGLDANPWRTYQRIITSYHYLRQPDVQEQFLSACRQPEGSAHLPWDLLIVDEAHNLMPSNFGEDSDLAKMLRHISPWFEHKLFLTATPHNGHTRCFSGLLEQLDPVRFTQTAELTESAKRQIEQVVVRRLKREINELDESEGRIPRFAERYIDPVPLYFGLEERALSEAFQQFRHAVKNLIASLRRIEQLAGNFAVEVLNKRLLSCPYTFADSWYRFKEGIAQAERAEVSEIQAARRAVAEELDDDREAEGRVNHAARVTGAWLKPLVPYLSNEINEVDVALRNLGLVPMDDGLIPMPLEDERWKRVVQLIKQRLRNGHLWNNDERLIMFTEYKTTLDYLESRLKDTFKDDKAIRVLYGGGMDDQERKDIKRAFNDPNDPVRVLVATDVASEGQNLQETARFLLHYEIPWNPARLEQRNGRLDRHGQARDVTVFHFTSEDDADLKFLGHVINKANSIREDLGSMTEVFDAAFQQRFFDLQDADTVVDGLDVDIERHKGRAKIPRPQIIDIGQKELKELQHFAGEIDLSPETLKSTLEIALGIGMGLPRFDEPDSRGRLKLKIPLPPKWEHIIDDSLRIDTESGNRGVLPAVVFDPQHFIETRNGRHIFRAPKDTALLHLGHPLFHQALAMFARTRFPGAVEAPPSRWTVRYGEIHSDVEALLLLTIEELAVNELREPFHHWVHTIRLPIKNGKLQEPLPHLPSSEDRAYTRNPDEKAVQRAQDLWDEVARDVKSLVADLALNLTTQIEQQIAITGKEALAEEKERFRLRLKEVEKAMRETTIQSLEKERAKLLTDMQQGMLFPEFLRQKEEALRNLEEELRLRRSHFEDLYRDLEHEQKRVIDYMIPKRYRLRGQAQVFPVTVEIRLPEVI
jgi:superfamily II DNA or RNA helicase